MQEHHLKVTRTARYYIQGDIDGPLKQVWFVCHGQGQLAAYFIKHFQDLDNGERLIVAPEGLSRFYLDPMAGRVGAIWMTKEDRLNEIEDYVNYLDALYNDIFSRLRRETVQVHVLGFSQGVATVCRWVGRGNMKAEHLTLWAGMIPPDLDLNATKHIFENLKLNVVVGDQDEYVQPGMVTLEEERLKSHELKYRLISFTGTHQLNAEVLKELADSYPIVINQ